MDLALEVACEYGLDWPRWKRLALAAEELGYAGVFRSDHLCSLSPPERDCLELWVSLSWLASHTRRVEIGPLVTPLSYRDPAMTARMACAVDDLSGGVGAGWSPLEHERFGHELLPPGARLDRLAEGLEVLRLLLEEDGPADFRGRHFRLAGARLLPRPPANGLPLVVGGNGPARTLPLVARYADEWNATFLTPARLREMNRRLDALLERERRDPREVRRSLATILVFGRDDAQLRARLAGGPVSRVRELGLLAGTPNQVVDQLGELAEAGAERVMLTWVDLDDVETLEAVAKDVLPQL